jgi:hypothetical protein
MITSCIIREPEAASEVVVDGDCLVAAAERAEPDPLVDERVGDQLAQRRLARRADRPTMLS